MLTTGYRITLEKVSKKFHLGYKQQVSTLAGILAVITGKQQKKEVWVLKDVSFSVESGEIIGLIGRNGSGKSTLLKAIAQVYQPDEGMVEVQGKLAYVAGLGKGLKKQLTMRENIFLGAALMGLNEQEARRVFEDIVDFSGLHDFIDGKLDHFSSGMALRLGFSISVFCVQHQKPDILLLDEVFGAGGDIDFNAKATGKMEELVKGGTTVVLVSHNMEIVKKYCRRTVWLEQGAIAAIGETNKIVQAYQDAALKRMAKGI